MSKLIEDENDTIRNDLTKVKGISFASENEKTISFNISGYNSEAYKTAYRMFSKRLISVLPSNGNKFKFVYHKVFRSESEIL